jgi:hypothetical protein
VPVCVPVRTLYICNDLSTGVSKYFYKYRDTGIDISKIIAYTFHIKFS